MRCTAAVAAALTRAQGVAGALLHRHALTERPPVQRRWVGAGACPLLDPTATAHVACRPVRPRRPAPVHCSGGGRMGEMEGGVGEGKDP